MITHKILVSDEDRMFCRQLDLPFAIRDTDFIQFPSFDELPVSRITIDSMTGDRIVECIVLDSQPDGFWEGLSEGGWTDLGATT